MCNTRLHRARVRHEISPVSIDVAPRIAQGLVAIAALLICQTWATSALAVGPLLGEQTPVSGAYPLRSSVWRPGIVPVCWENAHFGNAEGRRWVQLEHYRQTAPPDMVETLCPPGRTLTGLKVHADSAGLHGIAALRCTRLRSFHGLDIRETRVDGGVLEGEPESIDCRPFTQANGLHVRAEYDAVGIALGCSVTQ